MTTLEHRARSRSVQASETTFEKAKRENPRAYSTIVPEKPVWIEGRIWTDLSGNKWKAVRHWMSGRLKNCWANSLDAESEKGDI